MKPITAFLSLATFATLATTACTDPGPEPTGDRTRELARIDGAHGSLRFFAAADGSIAISERTDLRRTAAEALIADDHATPLELYLALAPAGSDAPDALWADHLATAGEPTPRALTVPRASSTGVEPFDDCTSADWRDFLAGVQAPYAFNYWRWINTGGPIATLSESDSRVRRRFDACAAANAPSYPQISVLIGSKLDDETGYGAWDVFEHIGPNERFWFANWGGLPDWAMSVQNPGNGSVRSVGLGRAESH